MLSAFIVGCSGPVLTESERAFLQEARPCGLILFARNCVSPSQIRALANAFREAVGTDEALVLIDQEGGRVQRMGPPHWRRYPPARAFGALHARDPDRALSAARHVAALMGRDLAPLGIDVDCAPVLDVPAADGHRIIGDRAFASEPETVAALGRAFCEGLLAQGVLPVIKHIPGHGRARADSHEALPVVEADPSALAAVDFRPFQALKDMPLAMTAHVVYGAIDAAAPATTSERVIAEVVRGAIGFHGLLMSDDVSMRALRGPLAERAGATWAAGVDVVLHCNGALPEMMTLADVARPLEGSALRRLQAARARIRPPALLDETRAEAALAQALEYGSPARG